MKRIWGGLMLALWLLCGVQAAHADEMLMRVYIAQGALTQDAAQRLMTLLSEAYPQAQWQAEMQEETGNDLRALVLADRAPQLAICAPQEAEPWAREGLLAAPRVSGETLMQRQVLTACTWDGNLFMVPLMAKHRMMAVNRGMMEKRRMGYLLNTVEHAVWYPSEFHQVLEEFALTETPALEIWPAQPENSAALEALVLSLSGGLLLSEDGKTCLANSGETVGGMAWLRDRVAAGLIQCARSREEALAHFLNGQTALFLDFTRQDEQQYARELRALDWMQIPYPSLNGFPVRTFDVIGAAVFEQEDERQSQLALQAAGFFNEAIQPQLILGQRTIWEDGARWLPCLSASSRGQTVRSLFCDALRSVLEEGIAPGQAMQVLCAAMEVGG